jgi:hypothetical protein
MPTLEDFNEELEGQVAPEQGELSFDPDGPQPPQPDTDHPNGAVSEETAAGARHPETGKG